MERSPDSTKLYIESAQKIERISKKSYIILFKFVLPGIILPPLIRTIIRYSFYHLSSDETFLLPCEMLCVKIEFMNVFWPKSISCFFFFQRLPINLNTPLGYLFAIFAEFVGINCALLFCSAVVSFHIGSCCLNTCIVEDIKNDLIRLNGNEKSANSKTMNEELTECIYYIEQFYIDAKKLRTKTKN